MIQGATLAKIGASIVPHWQMLLIAILTGCLYWQNHRIANYKEDLVEAADKYARIQNSNKALIAGIVKRNELALEETAKYEQIQRERTELTRNIRAMRDKARNNIKQVLNAPTPTDSSESIEFLRYYLDVIGFQNDDN